MRQRRHITNGQFPNLAAADLLGFSDRGIAIFEDPPGVDQERLPAGVSVTPLRCLSNKSIPSAQRLLISECIMTSLMIILSNLPLPEWIRTYLQREQYSRLASLGFNFFL